MVRILIVAVALMLGLAGPAAAQLQEQGAQSPPGQQMTPGAPGKPASDRCPEESSAKSIAGNQATSIVFQNNRSSAVRMTIRVGANSMPTSILASRWSSR